MMTKKLTLLFILVFVVLCSVTVFGKQAYTPIPNTLIQVVPQGFDTYENGNITFFFRTFNSTGFCLKNDTVDCNMTVYQHNSVVGYKMMDFMNPTDFTASFVLTPGEYTYSVYCNNSEAGFITDTFDVFQSGESYNESSNNLSITLILLSLILLLVYLGHRFTTSDDKYKALLFYIGLIFYSSALMLFVFMLFLVLSWSGAFVYYGMLRVIFITASVILGGVNFVGFLAIVLLIILETYLLMFKGGKNR